MDPLAVIEIVLIIAATITAINSISYLEEVIETKRDTHSNNALKEDLQATFARLLVDEESDTRVRAAWIEQYRRHGYDARLLEAEQRRAEQRSARYQAALDKLGAARRGPTAYDPESVSAQVEVEAYAD